MIKVNKKFWATTFTLTGTIIGAGILGLPSVISKSGFLIGIILIFLLGALMCFVNLSLAEVTLRTQGKHQLPGYARKYLGKRGEIAMFFAMVFGMYSALLAYLVGEGNSLSQIIPLPINPIIWGILFWAIMTLLLREGLKELKKIETYGVITIILVVIGIFILFLPQVNIENLSTNTPQNIFIPIGVILFSFLGFSSMPELRMEIKGQEKKLKKAIIIGFTIPIFLYILFTIIVIGSMGTGVSEIATLSFGKPMAILGFFTMLTSFFILSFSLRDIYKYDLKFSPKKTFFLASFLPLILYILIEYFRIASFSTILGAGGTISGGLTGILILVMNKKARKNKRGGKEPEIKMPTSLPLIIILSMIFIAGIILQFTH